MQKAALALICGFIALLSGCSTMSSSDVVGRYRDNNSLGSSNLTLKPDGTFSQQLVTKAGTKYTATGKWSFNNKDNYILLDDALSFKFDSLTSSKLQVERIDMSLPVEKLFGKTQIVVNGDKSIAFSKIK